MRGSYLCDIYTRSVMQKAPKKRSAVIFEYLDCLDQDGEEETAERK